MNFNNDNLLKLAGSKTYRSSLRRRLDDWRFLRSKRRKKVSEIEINIKGMWSNVQLSDGCPAPSSPVETCHVRLCDRVHLPPGGRSANLPLKDL
ncbi:hypothetical protein CEXT_72041 [Caerostris extrusa]|uniref:Uncharacterized protein n=1 Tax=Caerostris extrusa TaxID=172846 RepID=A0AAV4XZJ4_CAEEX|nr:hypothetical protein CEXT_72041 [Caerostris extrusa]